MGIFYKQNWYNFLKSASANKVYHSTHEKNISNIMQNGLLINQTANHTLAGDWAVEYYGMQPIYVSLKPDIYSGIVLEIDATGYQLYPDLPALIDTGAYLDENGFIWWENPPKGFADQEYDIQDILNDIDLAKKVIKLTGTAAILENIPSNRIKLLR